MKRKLKLLAEIAKTIELSDQNYTLGEALFALEHLLEYYRSKGDLPNRMSIREVAKINGTLEINH